MCAVYQSVFSIVLKSRTLVGQLLSVSRIGKKDIYHHEDIYGIQNTILRLNHVTIYAVFLLFSNFIIQHSH